MVSRRSADHVVQLFTVALVAMLYLSQRVEGCTFGVPHVVDLNPIRDVRLNYAYTTVAAPLGTLIFVHGTAASLRSHLPLVQNTAGCGAYNILAYDLAGMGASQNGPALPYTVASMVDDLDALLTYLGISSTASHKLIVIAHSLGAIITKEFVLRYRPANPSRPANWAARQLDRVVLIGGASGGSKSSVLTLGFSPIVALLPPSMFTAPYVTPLIDILVDGFKPLFQRLADGLLYPVLELLPKASKDLFSQPPFAAFVRAAQDGLNSYLNSTSNSTMPAAYRAELQEDVLKLTPQVAKAVVSSLAADGGGTSSVPSIRMPALLVWGSRDVVFGPSVQEQLAQEWCGSVSLVLPGKGHYVHAEDPVTVGAAIGRFLTDTNYLCAGSVSQL